MKKINVMVFISAVFVIALSGCSYKDSEAEKIIKESHENSRLTSGSNQELPRLKAKFEKPKSKEGDK